MTPPNQPCALQLAAGDYRWCACGKSQSLPFCDDQPGCTPKAFTVKPRKTPETLWLCGCAATKTPPYCDGSHNKLGPKTGWSKLA